MSPFSGRQYPSITVYSPTHDALRRLFVEFGKDANWQNHGQFSHFNEPSPLGCLLHSHVFAQRLADFSAEAQRRGLIKKDITTESDLGELKEFNFLEVAKAIGVIDKNEKLQLEERLRFRNSCGHPNKLQMRSRMVAAHIESLILNVFDRF